MGGWGGSLGGGPGDLGGRAALGGLWVREHWVETLAPEFSRMVAWMKVRKTPGSS